MIQSNEQWTAWYESSVPNQEVELLSLAANSPSMFQPKASEAEQTE